MRVHDSLVSSEWLAMAYTPSIRDLTWFAIPERRDRGHGVTNPLRVGFTDVVRDDAGTSARIGESSTF
jgi:hypothetical protein